MCVTLADAKNYLGISLDDCLDDERLGQIINGARDAVEDYLGTPLVRKTFTQRFYGGFDDSPWITDVYPVASVTSIVDPAGNTIQPDKYVLEGEIGVLRFYDYPPRAVRSTGETDRWTLTYVAGHFEHENVVPWGAKLGILLWIAARYTVHIPAVQSMRTGDSTISLIPNPTAREIMPRDVTTQVAQWRRKRT